MSYTKMQQLIRTTKIGSLDVAKIGQCLRMDDAVSLQGLLADLNRANVIGLCEPTILDSAYDEGAVKCVEYLLSNATAIPESFIQKLVNAPNVNILEPIMKQLEIGDRDTGILNRVLTGMEKYIKGVDIKTMQDEIKVLNLIDYLYEKDDGDLNKILMIFISVYTGDELGLLESSVYLRYDVNAEFYNAYFTKYINKQTSSNYTDINSAMRKLIKADSLSYIDICLKSKIWNVNDCLLLAAQVDSLGIARTLMNNDLVLLKIQEGIINIEEAVKYAASTTKNAAMVRILLDSDTKVPDTSSWDISPEMAKVFKDCSD